MVFGHRKRFFARAISASSETPALPPVQSPAGVFFTCTARIHPPVVERLRCAGCNRVPASVLTRAARASCATPFPAVDRIQCGTRSFTKRTQLRSIGSQHIDRLCVPVFHPAAQKDLAGRWFDQAQNAAGRGRLAAARFTYQSQGGSPGYVERNSCDRRDLGLAARDEARPKMESLHEILNGDRQIL